MVDTWDMMDPATGQVTTFSLQHGEKGIGLMYRVTHNNRERWMCYRLVTSREAADKLLTERGFVPT